MQIAQLLFSIRRLCRWELLLNPGGRMTKVPDQSTTDVSACRSWKEAVDNWVSNERQGIGIVFTGRIEVSNGDGVKFLVALDLDSCRDPQTGEVAEWAKKLIAKCKNSWTEVSPSGTGLHVFVFVRHLVPMRSKVRVAETPMCETKTPELQVFGLGPAQYIAFTGDHLEGTDAYVRTLDDLSWLIEEFGMQAEKATEVMPEGRGGAPSRDAIDERVRRVAHGPELADGKWWLAMPDKSASEAYHVLVQHALRAANGHGAAAVDWLLSTPWGRGEIDNSADPGKYARRSWVEKDVKRVAGKSGAGHEGDVFGKIVRGGGAADVLDGWAKSGPLVHLPTGIESIDLRTGGGFVLGSRVFLVGAPDAGKTLLAMHIADVYLQRGIVVGILGVDEEPSDLVTRMLQRRGISRDECEDRSPATIERARELLEDLPLKLFDGDTTIERAAVELNAFAAGRPCVLIIDSIQTARSEAEDADDSLYRSVTRRVAAVRAAATRYGMLMLVTSEMNRGAYKHRKIEDQTADLASAKESGAIEFSARVLLALRSVPNTSDTIECRIAKNKHGASHRADETGIFLRIGRADQTIEEDAGFSPLTDDVAEIQQEVLADAVLVTELLLNSGPMGVRAIHSAARTAGGLSRARIEAAMRALADGLMETPGPRNSRVFSVRVRGLPADVLAELSIEALEKAEKLDRE